MTDPALRLLLRLRLRAAVRRVLRPGAGKRRLVTILGIVLVGLWVLPAALSAVLIGGAYDPAPVLRVGPVLLAVVCLWPVIFGNLGTRGAANSSAIAFSPAEIDLLFPAPFPRRSLLLYKLASGMGGAVVMSLLFSVFFLRHAGSWPGAVLSIFAALVFAQLIATAAALVRLRIAESAYTRARRVLLGAALVAAAVAIGRAAAEVPDLNVGELARRAREHPVVMTLLWPFEVFVRAFVAERIGPFLRWLAIGWGLNAAMLLIVLRLDSDYRDASISASQRLYERLQRMRRGSPWSASIGSSAARRRVPPLPYLAGAGPLIWRQATIALRGARSAIAGLVIVAVVVAFTFRTGRGGDSGPVIGLAAFIMVWLTMMLSAVFRFDFRADLDHIETLKTLPLRPATVAAGQLAVPALVLGGVQVAAVSVAALAGAVEPEIALAVGAAAPLVTFLWLAADNFVFLLAPSRPPAGGTIDFHAVGRQMVLMLAKAGLFVIAVLGGGFMGAGVYWVSGSIVAAAVVAWGALVTVAVMMLQAVGWAFARFDPSADLPG